MCPAFCLSTPVVLLTDRLPCCLRLQSALTKWCTGYITDTMKYDPEACACALPGYSTQKSICPDGLSPTGTNTACADGIITMLEQCTAEQVGGWVGVPVWVGGWLRLCGRGRLRGGLIDQAPWLPASGAGSLAARSAPLQRSRMFLAHSSALPAAHHCTHACLLASWLPSRPPPAAEVDARRHDSRPALPPGLSQVGCPLLSLPTAGRPSCPAALHGGSWASACLPIHTSYVYITTHVCVSPLMCGICPPPPPPVRHPCCSGQAVVFVVRTVKHSFLSRAGTLTYVAFLAAQTAATLVAALGFNGYDDPPNPVKDCEVGGWGRGG